MPFLNIFNNFVLINDSDNNRSTRLSQIDKIEIEKAGRGAAEITLKENGYDVEQMPQDNPGFDLMAKKDGKELRIEIKAHRGFQTVLKFLNAK